MEFWSKKLLMVSGKKEPLYYCYTASTSNGVAYYYAEAPLNSNTSVYCHRNLAIYLPTKSSDLTSITGNWYRLSETSGRWSNSSVDHNCTRYYEGDLYE